MATARAITVIPPTTGRLEPITTVVTKKRVVVYARVSTDNDEQLSSFDAQMDYYTRHIKSNSAWNIQTREFPRPVQKSVRVLIE